MDLNIESNDDCKRECTMTSEQRKKQLREAQQRRRAKLAKGERSQVSLYFDRNNLELMDAWCTQFRLDRNDFINNLIAGLSNSPERLPELIYAL